VQVQKSAAKATIADSIEIEGSIFLLFVSAMFFALETLFHYESFIHEITLKNVAPEALDLIIGSAIIAVIYAWLGYSCLKDRTNADTFIVAAFICGFLIFAYFVVEIIDTGFPQFYYAAYLEYGQFVSGYGSVTILTEMLSLFFTYRAYKILPK
jgi:hypothetical protein